MPEDNSFFLKRKNELPQVGFKPATFCVLAGQTLYQQSHRGSSAGQAESLKFMQGKGRLSPDGQGKPILVLYRTYGGVLKIDLCDM